MMMRHRTPVIHQAGAYGRVHEGTADPMQVD